MIYLKCYDTKQAKQTLPTFPETDKNLSEISSAIKVLLRMKKCL